MRAAACGPISHIDAFVLDSTSSGQWRPEICRSASAEGRLSDPQPGLLAA